MKMNCKLFLCLAALALSLAAGAQTLKPVKDKATKKYGYQDNSKNWVIAPAYDDAKKMDEFGCAQVKVNNRYGLINRNGEWLLQPEYDDIGKFDKNGFCELMIKEGKTKYYGVANRFGTIILPVEFDNVKIPKDGLYITASREVDREGSEGEPLWGVYTLDGEEIFTPQFSSAPSNYDGILVAKDGKTNLAGVVDLEAHVLLPFDFLAISHHNSGFTALSKDFRHIRYNTAFRPVESVTLPGSVIPYDDKADAVRVAAWHCGPVGLRLHANQVRLVEGQISSSARSARCSQLALDWGRGRFLRLEPEETYYEEPDAMEDPLSKKYYTLKALLYEADGTLVGEVAEKGYLEGECAAGALYRADGKETWLILADPNAPATPGYTLSLADFRAFNHSNVVDGLGIRPNELMRLGNVKNFARQVTNILEGENVGITSYVPLPIDAVHAREQRNVTRENIFYHTFHIGDVVSCFVRTREEGVEVDLYEQLVCRFSDHFEDPYYSMSGEETIYWGPNNRRTVRVTLEPTTDTNALVDDVSGSSARWCVALNMYEEDGTWLRTLARMPYADFAQDGIIVFRNAGIALLNSSAQRRTREVFGGRSGFGDLKGRVYRTIKLPGALPLPHTVSALKAYSERPR